MSDNIIITEYVEETKVAQLLLQPQSVRDHEEFSKPEAPVMTIGDPMAMPGHHDHGTPAIQVLEVGEDIGKVTEFLGSFQAQSKSNLDKSFPV